jgi:hypothetical protein
MQTGEVGSGNWKEEIRGRELRSGSSNWELKIGKRKLAGGS